jgi:hypothetical protein
MREATGGLLMMDLVVIILFVFIFFIAGFMQFARVNKIKSTMVSAIERAEGGVRNESELDKILAKAGYVGPYTFCKCTTQKRGVYYSIQIYSSIKLPFSLTVAIPVIGRTRTIDMGIFYDDPNQEIFRNGGNVSTDAIPDELGGGQYQCLTGNNES